MRGGLGYFFVAALIVAAPLGAAGVRAEGPTASVSPRQVDRRVQIINDTGVAMTEFYATNIGVEGWGSDRFGDRTLGAKERLTVNIDDGSGACWFDLRAVFDDGDVVIRRNFNVCKETGWRVFERKPAEIGQMV